MTNYKHILIGLCISIFLLGILIVWSGYSGILAQIYFSNNKLFVPQKMFSYNVETTWGSYAFHYNKFLFFWTLYGLKKIDVSNISSIVYNNKCSSASIELREKYAFFEDLQIAVDLKSNYNFLNKLKRGSPVVFYLDSNGGIYASIYDYIPQEKNGSKLICFN